MQAKPTESRQRENHTPTFARCFVNATLNPGGFHEELAFFVGPHGTSQPSKWIFVDQLGFDCSVENLLTEPRPSPDSRLRHGSPILLASIPLRLKPRDKLFRVKGRDARKRARTVKVNQQVVFRFADDDASALLNAQTGHEPLTPLSKRNVLALLPGFGQTERHQLAMMLFVEARNPFAYLKRWRDTAQCVVHQRFDFQFERVGVLLGYAPKIDRMRSTATPHKTNFT
ncbi:hypothetical protein [Rosistilla ulvae]|uniref:hypothetical protein n=1 Tax=Rosistilla ulvae TaxID=1930277 RepID=UPI001C54EFEA|nr:hypothetical protein [Rosistilla ulvae]